MYMNKVARVVPLFGAEVHVCFLLGPLQGGPTKRFWRWRTREPCELGGGSQRTVKDCSIFTTMKGFDGGTFAVFWDAC